MYQTGTERRKEKKTVCVRFRKPGRNNNIGRLNWVLGAGRRQPWLRRAPGSSAKGFWVTTDEEDFDEGFLLLGYRLQADWWAREGLVGETWQDRPR